MPVEILYESRDAVPETLVSHVVERDGKFVFQAEPLSVVSETQSKLKKLRADLDAKAAALGKYGKLNELGDDLDIDELLELRELKKQGKPLTPDEKNDIERLHAKATRKLSDELTAATSKLSAYEAELKQFKLINPIRDIAVAESVGMFPEDFNLAWSEIGSRFKLVEEDGKKPRIVVLDEDGDVTDIKPEDFFNKLYKEKRPKFFKASGIGGSDAKQGTKGNGNAPRTRSEMTLAQKSAFIAEHGQDAYFKLPIKAS